MSHLLVFVDSDFRGAFVSADLFTAFAWSLGFAPETQKKTISAVWEQSTQTRCKCFTYNLHQLMNESHWRHTGGRCAVSVRAHITDITFRVGCSDTCCTCSSRADSWGPLNPLTLIWAGVTPHLLTHPQHRGAISQRLGVTAVLGFDLCCEFIHRCQQLPTKASCAGFPDKSTLVHAAALVFPKSPLATAQHSSY